MQQDRRILREEKQKKQTVAVRVTQNHATGVTLATASQDNQTVTTVSDPSYEGRVPAVVTPKLAIFNMPPEKDFPDQYVHSLLQQFGTPIGLHLVRDPVTNVRTCGFFDYLEGDLSVQLSIQALNGMYCGGQILRVTRLESKKQEDKKEILQPQQNPNLQTMTQKIMSNPFVAKRINHGREIGAKPSQVCQLLNTVTVEDLYDDVDYQEILQELKEDASRFGVVSSIVIPRPSKTNHSGEGVGKVFICFHDITSARRYQYEMNGRKFDERVVCAAFYPSEFFKKGKARI